MMMKWKCLRENTTKGMVNKCGLFAVLSVALSIVLSMSFSAVGNAQSVFDDKVEIQEQESYPIVLCGVYHRWTPDQMRELVNAYVFEYRTNHGTWGDYADVFDEIRLGLNNNQNSYYMRHPSTSSSSVLIEVFNKDSEWTMQAWDNNRRAAFFGENVDFIYRAQISFSQTTANFICDKKDYDVDDFDSLFTAMKEGYFNTDNNTFSHLVDIGPDNFNDRTERINVQNSNNIMGLRVITNSPSSNAQIYAFSGNLTLPEGYDGPEIPNAIAGDPEILATYAPDFQYTYNNLNLWASDHEQDLPVFEPDLEGYNDDGYRVEWTVWECRGGEWYAETASCDGGQTELLKLETLGLNENFTFDVPQLGEYRLQAEYRVSQCFRYGSYPETPDHCFSSSPSVEPNLQNYKWERRAVIIDMDGSAGGGDTLEMECGYGGFNCDPSTADGNMLPCFTRDFPYVNVNNCIKNVFSLFDVLTFSRQSIFGFTTNTLECKPIPRIGDWMNLENRYICPQFPSHVRDMVTPFITLTLGMFMVVFISRISRETYN